MNPTKTLASRTISLVVDRIAVGEGVSTANVGGAADFPELIPRNGSKPTPTSCLRDDQLSLVRLQLREGMSQPSELRAKHEKRVLGRAHNATESNMAGRARVADYRAAGEPNLSEHEEPQALPEPVPCGTVTTPLGAIGIPPQLAAPLKLSLSSRRHACASATQERPAAFPQ